MSVYAHILAYFYSVALSLWMVVISPGNVSGIFFQHPEKTASAEQVDDLKVNENLFLFSTNQSSAWGIRGDHSQDLDNFSLEHTYRNLCLADLCATVLAVLLAVEINFPFIDLLFPFHYFW